jgi:hypothetical protein
MNQMFSQVGKISKFVVGISGAVVTSLIAVYPASVDWLPAVVAGITAVLVYLVPNSAASDKPTVTPPV